MSLRSNQAAGGAICRWWWPRAVQVVAACGAGGGRVGWEVRSCMEGDKAPFDVRQLRELQRVVPPGKDVAEQQFDPLQRWRLAHHTCQARRSTHDGGGIVAPWALGWPNVPFLDEGRSVWTGNRSRSCLSRASMSAFSDAAGAGAGPAGAGACRSSSFCWIIFNPSSTSMTVQIDAIDSSVFLLVCSRKILVDSPCWAATQATGSQCGGGWLWCMGNGAGGGRRGSAPSVASSLPPLPRNSVSLCAGACHFHLSARNGQAQVGRYPGVTEALGVNPAIPPKPVGSRCATGAAARMTLRAAASVSCTWAAAEWGERGVGRVITSGGYK